MTGNQPESGQGPLTHSNGAAASIRASQLEAAEPTPTRYPHDSVDTSVFYAFASLSEALSELEAAVNIASDNGIAPQAMMEEPARRPLGAMLLQLPDEEQVSASGLRERIGALTYQLRGY